MSRCSSCGAFIGESPGSLFVDGTAKILDHEEFDDIRKIQELLETFEEKAKLVRILNACLNTREAGVRILIGRENLEGGMHNCTLVVAPVALSGSHRRSVRGRRSDAHGVRPCHQHRGLYRPPLQPAPQLELIGVRVGISEG